jgi:hypothetical protein
MTRFAILVLLVAGAAIFARPAAAAELPAEMLGTWCEDYSFAPKAPIITSLYAKRPCPADKPENYVTVERRSLSFFEVECRVLSVTRKGDSYHVTTRCKHEDLRPRRSWLILSVTGDSLTIQEPRVGEP